MKEKETMTFTKAVLSIIVLLYFIGALLGGVLVVVAAVVDTRLGNPIDSAMFIAYAAYLGGPTATAIAFYAWKSKCENLLKIQFGNAKVSEEHKVSIETLASIQS